MSEPTVPAAPEPDAVRMDWIERHADKIVVLIDDRYIALRRGDFSTFRDEIDARSEAPTVPEPAEQEEPSNG